jgi:hypothetical protein
MLIYAAIGIALTAVAAASAFLVGMALEKGGRGRCVLAWLSVLVLASSVASLLLLR